MEVMENNQFPNQPSGGPKPLGTGEGEVPLQNIPVENITMRTMDSDVKSIKENGGGNPTPYIPKQNIPPQNIPMGGDQFPPAQNIGGNSFPNEEPKKNKGVLIGIISFLVVIGLGLLGYFFVYPIFKNNPPPKPEVKQQTPPPAPDNKVEKPLPPVTEKPTSTEPQKPPQIIHSSLFKNPADVSSEISLSSVTLGAYQSSLQNTTADVPLFKEIVFKGGDNNIIPFASLMEVIAPQTFSAIRDSFNQDATFFTYTDSKGTWPGLLVNLKPGITASNVQSAIKSMEQNGEAKNFFLTDPGTATGWSDGTVGSFSARYTKFSKDGASFNYFFANNTLVISTNYLGAKEALLKLGL